MMTNPITWLKARFNNWLFYRAFRRAPVRRLGEVWVKEVGGNLYVVDKPMDDARQECGCFQCTGHGTR